MQQIINDMLTLSHLENVERKSPIDTEIDMPELGSATPSPPCRRPLRSVPMSCPVNLLSQVRLQGWKRM
ncbi:MAG: hypothetical protein R3E89_16535 [Thiolinea sp.]